MNVIDIKNYRALQERRKQQHEYLSKLPDLSKPELLQELLNYHECYQRSPHDINVTIRGQHLVKILAERSELSELQELLQELQNKLKIRLYQQMQNLKLSDQKG